MLGSSAINTIGNSHINIDKPFPAHYPVLIIPFEGNGRTRPGIFYHMINVHVVHLDRDGTT